MSDSFAAVAGSFTIERILARMKSAAVSLAVLSNRMSLKVAQNRRPEARDIHALMRPLAGVVPLPFERLEAWDLGHIGRGQAADGGNQKPRRHRLAGLGGHPPEISGSIILCPGDPRFEADVAVQVEAVGDVIEVAQNLRLPGVAFGPLPLSLQLFREGVGVAMTF